MKFCLIPFKANHPANLVEKLKSQFQFLLTTFRCSLSYCLPLLYVCLVQRVLTIYKTTALQYMQL